VISGLCPELITLKISVILPIDQKAWALDFIPSLPEGTVASDVLVNFPGHKLGR
jgi:hypothetical protein